MSGPMLRELYEPAEVQVAESRPLLPSTTPDDNPSVAFQSVQEEPDFGAADADNGRPPAFDEGAWNAQFQPDGPTSLPKHDWSRVFHAPTQPVAPVSDETLKEWVQQPSDDISITELQAVRLWAYTYNAASHPLYRHAHTVGYKIFVQLRHPLTNPAYHGHLYYAQELRGIPYVVEDTPPEPTDLDFGAFNPSEEMHILLTTLKAGATGVYQKVNQAAIAHIQAEQAALKTSPPPRTDLLARHIR